MRCRHALGPLLLSTLLLGAANVSHATGPVHGSYMLHMSEAAASAGEIRVDPRQPWQFEAAPNQPNTSWRIAQGANSHDILVTFPEPVHIHGLELSVSNAASRAPIDVVLLFDDGSAETVALSAEAGMLGRFLGVPRTPEAGTRTVKVGFAGSALDTALLHELSFVGRVARTEGPALTDLKAVKVTAERPFTIPGGSQRCGESGWGGYAFSGNDKRWDLEVTCATRNPSADDRTIAPGRAFDLLHIQDSGDGLVLMTADRATAFLVGLQPRGFLLRLGPDWTIADLNHLFAGSFRFSEPQRREQTMY